MIQSVLINDKWLKEFSVLPLNFNTKEVQNYIKLAEITWIVPIIGNAFYEELLHQIKVNKLSPENSTLLVEAMYPLEGFCIAYEAFPSLIYHVNETSVTKGHSDNSDAIDLKEANFFENHLRRQIEARKDYLIEFLNTHCKSYPLYCPTNCGCNDGCCNTDKGLNVPNPNWQVFSLKKKNTDLR